LPCAHTPPDRRSGPPLRPARFSVRLPVLFNNILHRGNLHDVQPPVDAVPRQQFGAGALLAAYVGRTTDTADAFKANLGAVFAAENTVRIGMYCMLGIITEAALKQALILVPFMAAGMYAGMKSAAVLDEKLVKKIAILFLILSGASLILLNVQ
jgi:hypothetical protein